MFPFLVRAKIGISRFHQTYLGLPTVRGERQRLALDARQFASAANVWNPHLHVGIAAAANKD